MRAPSFWFRPRQNAGIIPHILSPLSLIWSEITKRRLKKGSWTKVNVPIVCVGNINAGGTGKTPSVIALISILNRMEIRAHVISRGYGGSLEGPTKVDEKEHSAAEVGDEPLLIAPFAPCWVSKDRLLGVQAAVDAGAEVVILDDGFQNPSIHKDLNIVVVDAEVGFGNGYVIPAGPLREKLSDGLSRADVVLSIGNSNAQAAFSKEWPETNDITNWQGEIAPLNTGMDWSEMRVLAFAGIGRPQKFFDTLVSVGAHVVATHSFGDHEPYGDAILQRLLKEAKSQNAQLITTEKDMVRIPPRFRREVMPFPVRLSLNSEESVETILRDLLSAASK